MKTWEESSQELRARDLEVTAEEAAAHSYSASQHVRS